MKKLIYPLLSVMVFLSAWGCSDDSSPSGPDPDPNPVEASSEKQFVWNGMNEWYLWQAEVTDLADNRFNTDEAFQEFLMDYSDAQALYEDLQIPEDDFSFFIDDYEEYERNQDGIQAALGLNYSYFNYDESSDRIGFVRYVVPGSPADDAGLKRYDLFTKVDGQDLEGDNIIELLTTTESHTLTMARIDTSEGGISFPETGDEVTVMSEQVTEDPVYLSTVIDTSGIKIGYLKYNAFQGNSHQRLNEVFGMFQLEGIDELVLDLRYNGGGAVITSQLLTSLISGLGSSDTFANFTYNSKHSNLNETDTFLDVVPLQNSAGNFEVDSEGQFVNSEPANKLSMNRVYVLTSRGTASASEVTMNSLIPYIEVVQIGSQTIGKDVGSITLYDAAPDYTNKTNINPDHKKAIQPIVVSITNSEGENYPNGFTPPDYLDTNGLTLEALIEKEPLGSSQEPLFELAITEILNQPAKRLVDQEFGKLRELDPDLHIKEKRFPVNEMYIEPFMLPPRQNK